MIKGCPTKHPQHSVIQASGGGWTKEQIEKSGFVKTLDHSKKRGDPTVEACRIGAKSTGAEVLATEGADNGRGGQFGGAHCNEDPRGKDRVDETGRIANGQVTVTNHGDNTIREVRGCVYRGDASRMRETLGEAWRGG